ncbi:FecR domain-containing protein [Phenylobacterium sp.]|uniref:FecR family protein n=1 Tax=Phenylobacterium sp. TaxID=1871053 RepID=UPI0027316657|nr:FecR domain-containing protein [Phenylobacterium sp.]MDP1618665.1 FecR domain-containing protein [Phenylobacterium sp.]MDP1986570.1 FecR domain-containing protein [Phenylobacterium sp.]
MTSTTTDILQEAAAWVEWSSRVGAAEPRALADFEAWMAKSPAHREAYADLAALWRSEALVEAAAAVAARPRRRWRGFMRIGAPVGLALASAMMAVIFAPIFQFQTFETGRGEMRRLQLADGSTAHLSGAARVHIRQGLLGRTVVLDQGEAFFDVNKDGRPFEVQTDEARVQVLGTAFNVDRLASGRVELSVYRGAVSFRARGGPSEELGRGERASVDNGLLLVATPFDPLDGPDWMGGWFDASDASLAELVEKLDRFSERPITLANPQLGERRISGRFQISEPDKVMSVMAAAYGVRITEVGGRIVISDSEPQ